MAIAGRVAIVPKGEWSQSVTYDKLDLVTYNGNTFIAYKSSVGVEPVDGDTWMLVMQGIDPQDIENIINGTTPAGKAKDSEKLGGKGASEYALNSDLANYLPKTASTQQVLSVANRYVFQLNNTIADAKEAYLALVGAKTLGFLGCADINTPVFRDNTGKNYEILHTGNKPTGTYTGNGSATREPINTGGIGEALLISSTNGFAIITYYGVLTTETISSKSEANFRNGVLTLASTSNVLNKSGATYRYQVL